MDSENCTVGPKLKEIRKAKGLTLNELADKTELSTAYLSNIERNQTSPTVNNLFKISKALGVEIVDIMTDTSVLPNRLVTRREERDNLFGNVHSSILYESITAKEHDLVGVCVTIDSDCYDEVVSTGHVNYSEMGIQVEGSLLIRYNDSEEILNVGDTIYLPQNIPHGYKKYGKGRCVTYWIHAKEEKEEQ